MLLAHGTVSNISELPAFLHKIRRGRPAPAELVSELEHRYQAIGGSPHLDLTEKQAEALGKQLNMPCFVAMRLWNPTVESVLPGVESAGVRRLCLLPLAPFSVSVYDQAARRAAAELGSTVELVSVEPWGQRPEFVAAQADWIRRHQTETGSKSALLLTAHSLPMRAVKAGDAYGTEVEACCAAIGQALGQPVTLAYQSQGADGGEWLGPDLQETFKRLKAEGIEHITLYPFGFLSDHVETLYDLDIEAKAWAEELHLGYTRVPALNADPAFISALAAIASDALKA